jgi:L-lactate dehydrogenase complex protein LldE
MRVGIFIPCYVDQLAPQVGIATVELLERQGIAVEYPPEQGCCGQPFWTTGADAEARRLADHFAPVFDRYEHIVTPSGSCVATLRRLANEDIATRTYELCEFLASVLGLDAPSGRFPHRVGLHRSCHAREAPVRTLLRGLDGIELLEPARPDECCGFGGAFAVREAAVSSLMGRDCLGEHRAAGADVITSTDVSCLIHMDALARRAGLPVRLIHVAELLAEATA